MNRPVQTITKKLLEQRIRNCYSEMPSDPDGHPMGEIEAHMFEYFKDLIGMKRGKTTKPRGVPT